MYITVTVLQANRPTFLRLDPERTWAEELRGRIVREFPTVHVLLPSEARDYNIVDLKAQAPKLLAVHDDGGKFVHTKLGSQRLKPEPA